MGHRMKMVLLALLLTSVTVALAQAASTKFTNLAVTGTLAVTGNSAVTGNQTVTGTQTVIGDQSVTGVINTSASTPYAIAISSKTAAIPAGTPTKAGLIAFDSTWVMYVSTGTGPGAWVKVGGQ